jgi:hypothetical protein
VNLRAALALTVVLASVLLAGCGGSDDQVASVGDQTITVPSDAHGVYAELEAILDQLPYKPWYAKCVVAEVEKVLSPDEAEKLAELPESQREEKAMRITSKAGPVCEAKHHRPVIDPNASAKELDLLRAGYITSMTAVAKTGGADPEQAACIERGFENLTDKDLIAVGNGTKKVREGILLSIFKPCATGR